jgi:hypothetical protein
VLICVYLWFYAFFGIISLSIFETGICKIYTSLFNSLFNYLIVLTFYLASLLLSLKEVNYSGILRRGLGYVTGIGREIFGAAYH